MPESGVQIIPVQQADHALAEPNTFRIAGRPLDPPSSFGQLVHLFLSVFGGVSGLLARLFGGLRIHALSPSWSRKS